MTDIKTDVLILGGGTAGYACALECVKNGLDTVLVEKDFALGGTGLRTGCLPVKYLLDQVKLRLKAERSGLKVVFDQHQLFRECRKYIEKNSGRMEKVLKAEGVRCFYGNGNFLDGNTYEMEVGEGKRRILAKQVVLATGTRPGHPAEVNPDGERIITHRELAGLETAPEKLVILGGEVEGLEYASLFSELGSHVTLLEMMPEFLAGMDEDLREPLIRRLKENGVQLRNNCKVTGAEIHENGVMIYTDSGENFLGDKALVAMPRKANLPSGIDGIPVEIKQDRLVVNEDCQTSVAHVYAIGDLNGRMEMAHTAWQQGVFLGRHLAIGTPIPWEYQALPRVMFSIPENAGSGKQEKELLAEGIPYRKGVVRWSETWRGAVQPWSEGHVKVMVGEDDTLLGVWMTGLDIGDQVGFLGMMIQKGMKAQEIEKHLMVHPTLSEGIIQAINKARELGTGYRE